MALPQPHEDESPADRSDGEPVMGRPRPRPDWLTDGEAGTMEESAGMELRRDGAAGPRGLSSRPEHVEIEVVGGSRTPTPWGAAASSVPTLRVQQASARDSARAPAPEEFEDEAELPAFPDDDAGNGQIGTSAQAGALAPLAEPWWMVAADALRHDWRVQVSVGALVAALATLLLWPRGSPDIRLATLREHYERFNGRTVSVHGRVGDVFPIGGGYTFYLEQGKESIVVFTRYRVPVPRQKVKITGSISTGYLDGLPRQTLFETAP